MPWQAEAFKLASAVQAYFGARPGTMLRLTMRLESRQCGLSDWNLAGSSVKWSWHKWSWHVGPARHTFIFNDTSRHCFPADAVTAHVAYRALSCSKVSRLASLPLLPTCIPLSCSLKQYCRRPFVLCGEESIRHTYAFIYAASEPTMLLVHPNRRELLLQ